MKTLFTSERYHRNALTLFFLLLTVGINAQTRHDIEVTSNVFAPTSITIQVGDTVVWTNTQGSHNVNGKQSSYSSNPESFGNDVGTGWTYSHVFTIAGNYDYHCDPHLALGMTGKIIVEEIQQPTNKLTVNFTGMTPHVGQELKLAIVNKTTGNELARTSETVSESFSVEILGIENGESYFVDFFSDHSGNGAYDAPPTDHAWRMELNDVDGDETLDFAHNTSFTDIMWMNKLTVNFTGMTPHVGQTLKLALIDQATGMEKARTSVTVEESFEIHVMGIEDGKSYFVDFFSDHSGNGMYDAPPADHAWRMELNDVDGDETLDFAHNTSFTDIMWMNKLTVNFTGMTPHVGQTLKLALIDQATGMEKARTSVTVEESFEIHVMGIEYGKSYFVDFFSDHNGNGAYDAPPTDHAWRMELNDVDGDETLDFAHNTSFTDIMWMNKLTVNFTGMTPHVGQTLKLALIDQATGMEKARISVTVEESFEIHVMGIEDGKSYFVDFFSDHNGNGAYDAPPTDHAWRMELNDVDGDETLDFAHNTNFTDIMWMNKLTVNFTGMTPHVGQMLTLYLSDLQVGTYIDTIKITDIPVEFSLSSYKIEVGKSYELDFFADHNGNGEYNSPPIDHAWRMELINIQGDTTVVFSHNTNFTDISIATSADDLIYEDSDLVVYPNPSSEYVYLTSNRFKINEGNISLYNSLGTKIQASQVGMQSNRIGYNVQHLKPGLYLFKLETESATLVRKFIKK